jgi:hypothetical protein
MSAAEYPALSDSQRDALLAAFGGFTPLGGGPRDNDA